MHCQKFFKLFFFFFVTQVVVISCNNVNYSVKNGELNMEPPLLSVLKMQGFKDRKLVQITVEPFSLEAGFSAGVISSFLNKATLPTIFVNNQNSLRASQIIKVRNSLAFRKMAFYLPAFIVYDYFSGNAISEDIVKPLWKKFLLKKFEK